MNDGTDERMLTRRIAWDMLDHQTMYRPGVQEHFGLNPASVDVLDSEHSASDDRLDNVSPLTGRIAGLCRIASGIAHRAMLNYPADEPPDEESAAALATMVTNLTNAVVGQLLADGDIYLRSTEGSS